MPLQPHRTGRAMRAAVVFSLLSLTAVGVQAQKAGPFGRLAGQWSGKGTIDFSDGTHEPIRCKAAYDVLEDQRTLQLNIRCASESYNFDLHGSATNEHGSITGNWNEATRAIGGTLEGKADDGRFHVIATSSVFSATLTMITHGNRQSVAIRSQNPQSTLRGASIALQRS